MNDSKWPRSKTVAIVGAILLIGATIVGGFFIYRCDQRISDLLMKKSKLQGELEYCKWYSDRSDRDYTLGTILHKVVAVSIFQDDEIQRSYRDVYIQDLWNSNFKLIMAINRTDDSTLMDRLNNFKDQASSGNRASMDSLHEMGAQLSMDAAKFMVDKSATASDLSEKVESLKTCKAGLYWIQFILQVIGAVLILLKDLTNSSRIELEKGLR